MQKHQKRKTDVASVFFNEIEIMEKPTSRRQGEMVSKNRLENN